MKKILFISWDGPQTNYMEGLFFPIFKEIQKISEYRFHVIQFTWAGNDKIKTIQDAAASSGITYIAAPIFRKPIASLGSFYTVFRGSSIIAKYVKQNAIDILMPRSIFPAMMVNSLKLKNISVIYDADGLALEERVDFAGLSASSFQYKFLKKAELRMLRNADRVITRSQKSIDIHVKAIGEKERDKFFVVTNGRDVEHFKPNIEKRTEIRDELGISEETTLWVYCGSLGAQYGWTEMMAIFTEFLKTKLDSHFLILTGNVEYATANLTKALQKYCTIKKVPFEEVPNYLSAANIAFAIRKPTYSMQGVAPIKLGEYLLMELPMIASKGIGDTEEIIKNISGTFLFDHNDPLNIDNAVSFVLHHIKYSTDLRGLGLNNFSIENSAKTYLQAIN